MDLFSLLSRPRTMTRGAALAVAALAPAALVAQLQIAAWTPPGTTVSWRTNGNWSTSTFPNSPDVVAYFGAFDYTDSEVDGRPTTTITVQMTNAGGVQTIAALVLAPENTVDRRFRNNAVNSRGAITIHGGDVFIPILGQTYENLLVGNFSQDNSVRFYSSSGTQLMDVRFMNSGVIHVENPDAMVRFTSRIYEGDTPVTLTKTGAGILNIGIDFSDVDPDRVSITGDMIIKDGIIQNTYSGSVADGALVTSPYGFGSLVLEGGNVRSSTSTGRTIFNNVVLDGNIAFGSPLPEFNGAQTAATTGGGATTLRGSSELQVYNRLVWNQDITGDHTLGKTGEGVMVLSGTVDIGTFRVISGAAFLQGADDVSKRIVGNVEVGATGHFGGNGEVTGNVSIANGGRLAPGTEARAGNLTVGALTLSDGAVVDYSISSYDYASLVARGAIDLAEAELFLNFGFVPQVGDVFLLLQNEGGQAIGGRFRLEGQLLGEGDVVTYSANETSFDLAFSYLLGEGSSSFGFTVVPEPSTWALLGGGLFAGLIVLRRRRQA